MFKLLVLTGVAGAILAQDLQSPLVDRVVANQQFTEGPVWSPEGFLLFSELPSNKILKVGPDGLTIFRENAGGANGQAFDDKGRLYTCESKERRVTRTDKKGKTEVLAERFEGKRFNGPNDIAVSKSGHVYFTDPAFGRQLDTKELDFYGLYHITPKLEIHLIAKSPGRLNGVALSPKGDRLYVAGSDEKNVRAYDIGKDGVASNERVLVSNIEGIPGGIKVDEQGRLYVAARDVFIHAPDGKFLLKVDLTETPSNLAFSDASTLYVTARTSVYRLRWLGKGAEAN